MQIVAIKKAKTQTHRRQSMAIKEKGVHFGGRGGDGGAEGAAGIIACSKPYPPIPHTPSPPKNHTEQKAVFKENISSDSNSEREKVVCLNFRAY